MRLSLCKLTLLLLTATLFVTCSKKDDPKPPVYLLTKVTAALYTNEYTYDGEKATGLSYVNSGSAKVTGTFNYDGNGNITDIAYSDNGREVFIYTNGNITSRKRSDATNKLISQWDYEYSGSRIAKVQYYDVANGIAYSSSFRTFEYDDTSADPARTKDFTKNAPTTPYATYTYTYAQTKNAYSAAPAALKKYFRLLTTPIEKNIVKTTDGTTTWNYTYELNEQSYPTKSVEGSGGAPYTITYDYIVIK